MKFRLFILLSLLLFFSGCCVAENVQNLYITASIDSQVNKIQNSFMQVLPQKETIIFTKVPRGLILSIAEQEFFAPMDYKIKPGGRELLNKIISVLQEYKNDCVVESHTDEAIPADNQIQEDWELSIMRANAIVNYIVKNGNITTSRVFPVGFGETMPFKENVSRKGFSDRRVDFVIFDYAFTR